MFSAVRSLATKATYTQPISASLTRTMSTSSSTKVAVLGAGGIGQPLSMLLKLSPMIGELSCYDIQGCRMWMPGFPRVGAAAIAGFPAIEGGRGFEGIDNKEFAAVLGAQHVGVLLAWSGLMFLFKIRKRMIRRSRKKGGQRGKDKKKRAPRTCKTCGSSSCPMAKTKRPYGAVCNLVAQQQKRNNSKNKTVCKQ